MGVCPRLPPGTINLGWTLRKASDGELRSLEIESAEGADGTPWEQEVYQLVTSVLTSVLDDRRSTYFHRSLLYYVGPQLDGEYWLPGFRFAPAWPDDPSPHLVNAERVMVLDQDVPGLDDMHAQSVAQEIVQRNAARLSLLLNIGLYTPQSVQCWVMARDETEGTLSSSRQQRGYVDASARVAAMPRKRELCELGSYNGDVTSNYMVAGQLLSLPPQSRKILRGIDDADPDVTLAFDSGARLYQVANVCGQDFPSVGLAYRIAAVEAVCQADRRHQSFSDFVRAYASARPGMDDLLQELYGQVRSGHFHGGTFPAGEFSRKGLFDLFLGDEQLRQMEMTRACGEITREAIVNWIFDRVPDLEANG